MAPASGPHLAGLRFRLAAAEDAPSVAALHADSWRRHYRGSYPDSFLDGPVVEDRLSVWSERLSRPAGGTVTILAEGTEGVASAGPVVPVGAKVQGGGQIELVGFVHVVLDEDPERGALVDNLHVRADRKAGGIGTELLARAAAAVLDLRPRSGLYLWVLEANVAAQAFYRARGARFEGSRTTTPPGGGGSLNALRCVWPDPRSLARASG